MHFIEQWFSVSPDAGTGWTELLYVVAVVAAVLLIIAGRYVRRGPRHGSH